MRIDPSRLSRLLGALAKPAATSSSQRGERSAGLQQPQPGSSRAKPARDIALLRKSLQGRLKRLEEDAADYDSQAATITIQEILVWEFGPDILNRADFHHVTASITTTMLQDARIAASLRKLVKDMRG